MTYSVIHVTSLDAGEPTRDTIKPICWGGKTEKVNSGIEFIIFYIYYVYICS